jgi:hypothetical protein
MARGRCQSGNEHCGLSDDGIDQQRRIHAETLNVNTRSEGQRIAPDFAPLRAERRTEGRFTSPHEPLGSKNGNDSRSARRRSSVSADNA